MREERSGNGHHPNVEQFLEDIKVVLRDSQQLLKAGVHSVRQQARLGAESTQRYVRNKPYPVIGLAFGLGVVAGILAVGMFTSGGTSEEES